MKQCANCKWWRASEMSISCEFLEPSSIVRSPIDGKELKVPSSILRSEGLFATPIQACHHPWCFVLAADYDHIKGKPIKRKARIAGQAQFNPDGGCEKYKRKWWKFWVSESK